MFFLFQIIVLVGFIAIMLLGTGAIFNFASSGSSSMLSQTGPLLIIMTIWLLYLLAMIIPNAAVVVRRCHDQNMSGWVGGILYVLAIAMNLAGLTFLNIFGLLLLILMGIAGTSGPNTYGPDPKGDNVGDVFS